MRLLNDNGGNFGVITAALAVPLVMVVGMAVDYSRLDSIESKAQQAIDAAALSGLKDDNTIDLDLAAKVFKQNADLQFGLQIGSPDFEKDENGVWDGSITVRSKLLFGGFLLPSTVDINVSTSVGLVDIGGGPNIVPDMGCIHTLDNGSQSFIQNSGSQIDAPGCTLYIGSLLEPSKGKTGFNNGFHLDLKKICVGGTLNYDNRSDKSTPLIETACDVPADYYAPVASEAIATTEFKDVMNGSCINNNWISYDNNKSVKWTAAQEANKEAGYEFADVNDKVIILEPGKYCGGVNFNSGSYDIILKPGLYIIQNDWNINGQDIYGDDVSLFFDNNGKWQTNSNTGPMISAPTSGPFKGFAVWEDPTKSSNKDWTLNSNRSYSYFDGILYLPNRKVTLNSSAKATYTSTFMVDKLIINGGTKMTFEAVDPEHYPTSPLWSPPTKEGTGTSTGGKKVVRLFK